jgi:hypothetical protein
VLLPLYTPEEYGSNLQSTWCVLGGKSRVKVLSLDPRLLRLGQLLAKLRGVVPK